MKKKKIPVYWAGLGIYTAVLLVLGGCFLAYTDNSLMQYENSQPETAIKNYLSKFQQMAGDGTLCENIDMPDVPNDFESDEVYNDLYMARLKGISEYTFAKDADSYLTEEPVYNIYGDGEPIAKAAFSASNEHTIFGILTIMDWETKSVTPVLKVTAKDYTVRIPEGYTASVNGIALDDKYLTGEPVENPDYVNVADYVKMPMILEYKLSSLVNEPEIKVVDAEGNEQTAAADDKGNIVVSMRGTDEMPQERRDDALKMAQTWENFLTRDLGGENHGLATIRKYLLKDSYYWKIANEYAHSVDITFISSHTISDPPYSNVKVDDYVSYGENAYSCHIYFEKNMILKTGAKSVDKIDSTFYFVKYDDSDDGKDNPHWAIVDMVASTADGNG